METEGLVLTESLTTMEGLGVGLEKRIGFFSSGFSSTFPFLSFSSFSFFFCSNIVTFLALLHDVIFALFSLFALGVLCCLDGEEKNEGKRRELHKEKRRETKTVCSRFFSFCFCFCCWLSLVPHFFFSRRRAGAPRHTPRPPQNHHQIRSHMEVNDSNLGVLSNYLSQTFGGTADQIRSGLLFFFFFFFSSFSDCVVVVVSALLLC